MSILSNNRWDSIRGKALRKACLSSKVREINRKSFTSCFPFCRSALVPVYSFGENDLFSQVDNPKGSWLRSFQTRFMKIVSFAPLLFHGRGIFQYNFGFLPYRRHVTTIGNLLFSIILECKTLLSVRLLFHNV